MLRLDAEIYLDKIEKQAVAGVCRLGLATLKFGEWLRSKRALPKEIIELYASHSPLKSGWLGAGTLSDENGIMLLNDELPGIIENGFFIFGIAPNGDGIAIDFGAGEGGAGYISYEEVWGADDLRAVFIPVSPSLGCYVRDILDRNADLPSDYYEALSRARLKELPRHLTN